ncbi:hypothetical protein L208DRAFT_1528123, partial [Tricholoma matsutake]
MEIHILGIYAPNSVNENQQFWSDIVSKLRDPLVPPPDILLGDFNFVEDALDRLPSRYNSENITDSSVLKSNLDLHDGWHQANPDNITFTYSQSPAQGGSSSQIDRIYLCNALIPFSNDWDISTPGIMTDHQLKSARISDNCMPNIGKGRWTLPLFILKDKNLTREMISLGVDLHKSLEENTNNRTALKNPQTIFKDFRDKAHTTCKAFAKKAIPQAKIEIQKICDKMKSSLRDPSLDTEEKCLLPLQERINQEERNLHQSVRDNLAAKMRYEDENAASKFWARSVKE